MKFNIEAGNHTSNESNEQDGPFSAIEHSRQYTLSLIERYNLHAFTLRKISDHAPYDVRKDRKVPNYKGYRQRENAKPVDQCQDWSVNGGGLGFMGGLLECWPMGFPDIATMNEQERARYHRIHHKQAFFLDVDNCHLETAFVVMPSLADLPYVTRTDNPHKGKFFLLADVQDDIKHYQFTVPTEKDPNEVMFEVKALGAVWGKHTDNGHYVWANIDGQDVSEASLITVDMPAFEAFTKRLEDACIEKFAIDKEAAKKSQQAQAKKREEKSRARKHLTNEPRHDGILRHRSQPLPTMPDFPRSTDTRDVQTYDAGIYRASAWGTWRDKFPSLATLDYALHFLDHENSAQWNGKSEVKIPGHGGLHVNTHTGKWIIHGTDLGGRLPELVAYHHSFEARQKDGAALRSQATAVERKLASAWAGVPYPAFARPKSEVVAYLLPQVQPENLTPPPAPPIWLDMPLPPIETNHNLNESVFDSFYSLLPPPPPADWQDAPPIEEDLSIKPVFDYAFPPPPPAPPYEPVPPYGNQAIMLTGTQKIGQIVNLARLFVKAGWYLLQAPTGRGKTYAICDQFKTRLIIACPTQDLAKQVAKEYGLALVMEGVKVDFSKWRIATTYDGLQKIRRQAIKQDINLSDWTLAIDEIHHLVTDAYRLPALRAMMAIAGTFKRVIGISATLPPSLPFFENATVTRILAPMPAKPLYRIMVPDYTGLILNALNQYQRVIIHLNNKHVGQAIKDELAKSGIACELFNSTTKKEAHHEAMIMAGTLPDCRVLIVTSLFDDGYSFFNGQPYALILTATSRLSPFQVEQISARLRNNPPSATILARRADVITSEKDTQYFSYSGFLERKEREIKAKCDGYNAWLGGLIAAYSQDDQLYGRDVTEMARAQIFEDGALKGLVWNESLAQWQVDEVSLHQAAFNAWQAHCNKNPDRMIAELGAYGFENQGEWQANIDKEEAGKRNKRLAKRAAQSKADEQAAIAIELNAIDTLTDAERMADNYNNCMDGNQAGYDAANFVVRLVDAGLTFDCAKERLLDGRKLTSNEITRLESVVRFRKMRMAFGFGSPAVTGEAVFYRHLLDAFQAGTVLTKQVICDTFEDALTIAHHAPMVRDTYWLNDEKKQKAIRTRLINQMYSTKRRSATEKEITDFNLNNENVGHENHQKGLKNTKNDDFRVPQSDNKDLKQKRKRKQKKRPKVLEVLPESPNLYQLRTIKPAQTDIDQTVVEANQSPIANEPTHKQAGLFSQSKPKTDRELADKARDFADQMAFDRAKTCAKKIQDGGLRRRTLSYIKNQRPRRKAA